MNTPTSDILSRIVARKRQIIAEEQQKTDLRQMQSLAEKAEPTRGFTARLQADTQAAAAVIAEVKKASPSKGLIRPDFDPAAIARSYQLGGASCLSVLTDEDFFQGCNAYMQQARAACHLPVLRKEFIIDPWQVYQTRALGADALLLICAILDDDSLHQLYQLAIEVGLDCLVEVHDSEEMQRALALKPALIGINNRDLRTFKTDLNTSSALVKFAQKQMQDQQSPLFVAESGIDDNAHINQLTEDGIDAFLVGESLMRQPDPGKALQQLLTAP